MYIVKNRKGHVFVNFLEISEERMPNFTLDALLTHSLLVIKYQGKFLLMFNKWRNHWELPGGMINEGETPRECAVRELYEETSQTVPELQFKGLMKFRLKPDNRLEYGALYCGEILNVAPFEDNDEAASIVFWDKQFNIGYIDEIDEKLLEYY